MLSQSTIKMDKVSYEYDEDGSRYDPWESQSTIKMEKGYYGTRGNHPCSIKQVAIHNKNGKGLLPPVTRSSKLAAAKSQSTIKMEKGYYAPEKKAAADKAKRRNPQ